MGAGGTLERISESHLERVGVVDESLRRFWGRARLGLGHGERGCVFRIDSCHVYVVIQ